MNRYLYIGSTGFYFLDSRSDLSDFHKGITLLGEVGNIINQNLILKQESETAAKSNGDLRVQIDAQKKQIQRLDKRLREVLP